MHESNLADNDCKPEWILKYWLLRASVAVVRKWINDIVSIVEAWCSVWELEIVMRPICHSHSELYAVFCYQIKFIKKIFPAHDVDQVALDWNPETH